MGSLPPRCLPPQDSVPSGGRLSELVDPEAEDGVTHWPTVARIPGPDAWAAVLRQRPWSRRCGSAAAH
jgi:hypothetical protein